MAASRRERIGGSEILAAWRRERIGALVSLAASRRERRAVRVRAELVRGESRACACFRKSIEAKITTESNFSRFLLIFRSN